MGKKSRHNAWGEGKTERLPPCRITPTGKALLEQKAQEAGVSLAEYLEMVAREGPGK